MAYEITQAIKITNSVADVDWYYNGGNENGWTTLAAAKSGVPAAIRQKGRTVAVKDGNGVKEYWWRDGVADSDLVEKIVSASDISSLDDVPDGTTRKLANYLPLTGGVLYNGSTDSPLGIESNNATSSYIKFLNNAGTTLGYIGVNNSNKPVFYHNSSKQIALIEDIPAFPSIIDTAKSLNTDTTIITASSVYYIGRSLKTYFDNNSSTIPRNKLVHYICNVGSNPSVTVNIFGWWKDDNSGDGSFLLPSGVGLNIIRPQVDSSTVIRSLVLTNQNYREYAFPKAGGTLEYSTSSYLDNSPLNIANIAEPYSYIDFSVKLPYPLSGYANAKIGVSYDISNYYCKPYFVDNNNNQKQIALIEDINQTNVCAALGTGADDGSFLAKDGTWKVPTGGGGGQGANISLSGNVAESGKAFSSANYNANTGVITFSKTSFLTEHQDISGKANKSEMSITSGSGTATIQLKSGTSATVLTSHQDISGKADKSATVSNVTYNTSGKKLTKTINGSTTDIETSANIVMDGGGYSVIPTSTWFAGTAVTGTAASASVSVSGSAAGDMYWNTSTNNVYRAIAANTWKYIGSYLNILRAGTYTVDSSVNVIPTLDADIKTNIGYNVRLQNANVTVPDQRYNPSGYYNAKFMTNLIGIRTEVTDNNLYQNSNNSDCEVVGIYAKATGAGGAYAGKFIGKVSVSSSLTASSLYATSVYQTSDDRLKDYKGDFSFDINKLDAIPLRYFEYKDVKTKNGDDITKKDGKIRIGTSAQELEKVLPELVEESVNGYKNVDYSKLAIVALDCIKQQQKQIDELRKEIEILKKR